MNKPNAVTKTNYTHLSSTDMLPLSVVRFEPADPLAVKGIVQIVHGKNEHKGRYEELMRMLAENGYITVANDHRGNGESVIDAKDRGYFYNGGADALVRDLHEITLETKEYANDLCGRIDLPFTMLGHSMGSLAARCYIRKYDYELDKLCLLGSPSEPTILWTGMAFLRVLKLFKGKRAASKAADIFIMYLPYGLKYRKEHLKNSWTCTDRDAVIEQNNDPLCRYSLSISGYEEMLKMVKLTYKCGYTPKNRALQIRFFSGADDPCAGSRQKLAAAAQKLIKLGYKDTRFKMYKNMRHNILHEKNKELVFSDILKFIEK